MNNFFSLRNHSIRKMRNLILLFMFLMISSSINSQDDVNWRPDNRTGVSSEMGLMKSWPAEGPELLWSNPDLAKGHSAPSFGNNTIYITGLKDTMDILFALNMKGEILWQVPMGRAWNESYPESRATPTVEGDRVYTCSGLGDLACFNGLSGELIWSYKASEQNGGTYGRWGIAESVLIDGEKLYYSPGGPETMTIALKKSTGELIWRSGSIDDKPGYVSPILIGYAGIKMIVNISMDHVFAVDASNGDILWQIEHEQSSNPAMRRYELIKCTTPLYKDGMVYATGGYDTGGMMIRIAEDGRSANVVWTDLVLDDHHGGVVEIDGYIYGSNWVNNSRGNWCCIEWATGKKMWEETWNCKGSIISAEGMLYIYDERNGNVGLLKVNPEKFDLVSSFEITLGDQGPFWAHPVIHNKVLYIRHTNALMAYDIASK